MTAKLNTLGVLLCSILCATQLSAQTPRDKPAADPANPPQGRFSDYWMVIMLAGEKMGYIHAEQERAGDEIRTRMHTYMNVKRAAVALEIMIKTSSTESITGEPLAFSIEENYAQVPVRRKGTIREGMITVEAEQFGHKTTQQIAYPAGALMEWALHLETLKYKIEPGTVIKVDAFVPAQALNVGIPSTTEILERGEVDVLGKRVSALKTKTTTMINGVEIEATGWADEELTPIRQEMEIMGLKFEMIRCDMGFALEDVAPAEVFVSTLITVNRHIDRRAAKSVTYTFSGFDHAKIPDFPETGMQKIVSRKGSEVALKITRLDHDKLSRTKHVSPPADLAEFLQPSVVITSDDPAVVALAKSAAGGETDPYKLAGLLCRKVAREIEYKGLGTAFATAAEVCRNKSGDCTEHGVLLAALGRALGIPARVVTGLIYVRELAGREHVLGFHMWTQFWIAGQWVDLDAAWNQVDVDPTHITLGTHSLNHDSLASLVSGVMLEMGRLQVTIADIVPKQ